MKTEIFSRDQNPDVDRPLFYAGRERLEMLVATKSVLMLSKRKAQFVCELRDAKKRVEVMLAANPTDSGYDRDAHSDSRPRVWVPSGETWQMQTCYGNMSRHFTATHARDGMNFAPNKTTNPSDHQDIYV